MTRAYNTMFTRGGVNRHPYLVPYLRVCPGFRVERGSTEMVCHRFNMF